MNKKVIATGLVIITLMGGAAYAASMDSEEKIFLGSGAELGNILFNSIVGKIDIEVNGVTIVDALQKNEKAQAKLFQEEKEAAIKDAKEAGIKAGKKAGRKTGYDAGYKDGYAEKQHEKKVAEQKRKEKLAAEQAKVQKQASSNGQVANQNYSNNNYKAPSKNGMRSLGEFNTTAYTSDPAENGGWNGTAMGTPIRRGVVAVDPNVIPLGTRLYIEGYGYARAEDVGGAIKGRKIDVAVGSKGEAANWGRRSVNVYIVD